MFRFVLVLIAALASAPLSAQDWWYAESHRFRVYSSGGEEAARTMAVKLERLDQAMRLFTGVSPGDGTVPQVAKPTVFQFGVTRDIGALAGQDGVAGFFIPRAGNSVAFVPLEQGRGFDVQSSPGTRDRYAFFDYNIDPESVLFHEYAHYFMFQHAAAAYPSWYIEGLAEVFGTLRLTENGFALGDPPKHRMGEIAAMRVDTDRLFESNANASKYIDYPLYGHGWLASSYLSFAPERKGQLASYLRALNDGSDPREAAKAAFGDLKVLEKELNAYRNQRARGMEAKFPALAQPEVTLRKLTDGEVARMELLIKADAGVTRSQARGLVDEAREVGAKYPQSLPVQLTTLEAEFDAGNYDRAEALAAKILAEHPDSVKAHLFRARTAMEYAKKDPSWLATARTHFVAANKLDNQEPNALVGYYLTYRLSSQKPPEDALIALEDAYRMAPFDPEIRRLLAHLLLLEKRDESAKAVLSPLAYQPHGGKQARTLRELIAKLESGDRNALIEELAPSLEEKKDRDS